MNRTQNVDVDLDSQPPGSCVVRRYPSVAGLIERLRVGFSCEGSHRTDNVLKPVPVMFRFAPHLLLLQPRCTRSDRCVPSSRRVVGPPLRDHSTLDHRVRDRDSVPVRTTLLGRAPAGQWRSFDQAGAGALRLRVNPQEGGLHSSLPRGSGAGLAEHGSRFQNATALRLNGTARYVQSEMLRWGWANPGNWRRNPSVGG